MARYWINQPSTLQPMHERHGENIIAFPDTPKTFRAYPLSGEIVSFQIPRICLSEGWK